MFSFPSGKRHWGCGGLRMFGDCGYGCGCGCGCGDWCAAGTMCGNCKGGFGPPIGCGGCGWGCCSGLTFPCVFGACVNNPGCECCKKKPPKGQCQWPCMWPCCCQCTPPKFEPLKPKPVCHCASRRHHWSCKAGSHTRSGESILGIHVTAVILFYLLI